MPGKYIPYTEYKDSEVAWMGSIPKHWERIRFKHVIFEKRKTLNSTLDAGSISFGNVIYKNSENLSPDTKASYQEVLTNEFLINPLNLNFDLISLRIALSKINVVVSTGYIVLIAHGSYNKSYLRWLLREFDVAHMKTLGAGVRQTINYSDIANCYFFHPNVGEQAKIACFLDHETAKIDTLIDKQQQLIQLLKEKRQALISHAVTKGLNPKAKMRDSGVEWLGEIPNHWGITKLKYECSHIVDCMHSTPSYDANGEYPAIRTADIFPGNLDVVTCRRVTESTYKERNSRLAPREGDIIYSREGERFGIAAQVPQNVKICLGQRVMLFRANDTSGYLMWSLNAESTYKQAQQDVIGSTSPHVNVATIKNFYLAWPPADELASIASYIQKNLVVLDSIVDIANSKIALLHERRTSLISAVVTGKIDVRNWIAPKVSSTQKELAT